MNVIATEIPEVKIIEPVVFGDARGYFFESWTQERYKAAGIDCNWIQDNESRSRFGVLRGLTFVCVLYLLMPLLSTVIPLDAFRQLLDSSAMSRAFLSDSFFTAVLNGRLF